MLVPLVSCGPDSEIYDDHTGRKVAGPDHDHDHDHDHEHEHQDHEHDTVPLGRTQLGDLWVECAQDHGAVSAGHESYLSVSLAGDDAGDHLVRAWIGTRDRTRSRVALGEYDAGHKSYGLHVVAPSPLPQGFAWWIEVERPDGTLLVGSIAADLGQESGLESPD